jgi:hypothetical protein
VSGDEWIPLVSLGFVELVSDDGQSQVVEPEQLKVVAQVKPPGKKKKFTSVLDEAYTVELTAAVQTGTRSDNILGKALKAEREYNKAKEKINARTDDSGGTKEVDTQEAGSPVSVSTTES